MDEKSESDNPDVPAMDLVPKEEATVKAVCHKIRESLKTIKDKIYGKILNIDDCSYISLFY